MTLGRLASGWVVWGDDQRIPGYCLLLASPVVESIHSLSGPARTRFLLDMTLVGDALQAALGVTLINYSLLGNTDRELHAHIHPRYAAEPEDLRRMPPWFYHFHQRRWVGSDSDETATTRARVAEELSKINARKGL